MGRRREEGRVFVSGTWKRAPRRLRRGCQRGPERRWPRSGHFRSVDRNEYPTLREPLTRSRAPWRRLAAAAVAGGVAAGGRGGFRGGDDRGNGEGRAHDVAGERRGHLPAA